MFWGQRLVSGAATALAAMALGCGVGLGATWRLVPSATGSVEYTDNVRGVTSGAESDFVFTARPGLQLRGNGGRLKVNLNASASAEHYASTDGLDGYTPQLTGTANAELWENHLFLDASTSYRRSTLSRNGAVSTTDRNLGSNQSDVFTIGLSPSLIFNFARWAQSETRFNATQTMYDVLNQNDDPAAGSTSDSTTYGVSQTIQSGSKFQKFGWSLKASQTRNKRDSGTSNSGAGNTFKSTNAEASVQYAIYRWLTPNFRAGIDRFSDNSLNSGGNRQGKYWLVGVDLRPGPRSSLSFGVGRRFDDVTYNGSFSYRISSALNVSGNYSESVTTQQQLESDPFQFVGTDQFGNLIDTRTGLPLQPGDPGFDQSFTDVVFRSRNFRMGLSGSRLRNTYSLSWFVSKRDTNGSATPRNATTAGFSGSFSRQLWPDLRVSINGSYSDTSDNSAPDSRRYQIGSSLNYTLSESLSTGLSVQHLNRHTDGPGDTTLTENSVVLTVRKTF